MIQIDLQVSIRIKIRILMKVPTIHIERKNIEESSSSNLRFPLQPASSSSSRSQHNEIQFSFIEIPTFDNDLILRNFEAKNSIKHLNKKLFESFPKQ